MTSELLEQTLQGQDNLELEGYYNLLKVVIGNV